MDPINVASIFVSLIAAVAAYASQRAAAKASTKNVEATSRVDMEKEAYDRARKFDTETIARQDAEIDEIREVNKKLRTDNEKLRLDNDQLREEVKSLRRRIAKLEALLNPE